MMAIALSLRTAIVKVMSLLTIEEISKCSVSVVVERGEERQVRG